MTSDYILDNGACFLGTELRMSIFTRALGRLRGQTGRREADPPTPPAGPGAPFRARRINYYSADYNVIRRVGHTRPTPAFGAPTLAWHFGIWPHRENDPNNTTRPPEEEGNEFHRAAIDGYYERSARMMSQINAFLRAIQEKGRARPTDGSPPQLELFEPVDPHSLRPYDDVRGRADRDYDGTELFDDLAQETIGFTLWWGEAGPTTAPGPNDVRVRVQCEWHPDFITLSFFLDVTKPYGAVAVDVPRLLEGTEGRPFKTLSRRQRMAASVTRVRRISEDRLKRAASARETGVLTTADATSLLNDASYLYTGIWNEFTRDFKLNGDGATTAGGDTLNAVVGETCSVFASFRGLIMPVETAEGWTAADSASPRSQFERFANPTEDHPTASNEADRVLKAYWPFVRRITPAADNREFVACGIMGNRALYVTALGSLNEADGIDEAADGRAEDTVDPLPAYNANLPEPLQYLILTKGDPHRRQIGRIVSRVHALGTMRLFALKDWPVLKNASLHIRMRGQELDEMMRVWSTKRQEIALRLDRREIASDGADQEITDLTGAMEERLLGISAALDTIGRDATGGLHYRINRSRYYVKEFRILLETLRVREIETWLSYTNFVKRGLNPTFDFIDDLGTRLDALRRRLQSVTASIQTSALVAQTSATRQHTQEIKQIARLASGLNVLGATVAGFTVAQVLGDFLRSDSPGRLIAATFGRTIDEFSATSIDVSQIAAFLIVFVGYLAYIYVKLPSSHKSSKPKPAEHG
jgi:hypothetical protein